MKPNIEQVKEMAKSAAFYSNEEGSTRRMIFCDDEFFVVEDEDEGLFYNIPYNEVTFDGFECFYKLEQMTVPA